MSRVCSRSRKRSGGEGLYHVNSGESKRWISSSNSSSCASPAVAVAPSFPHLAAAMAGLAAVDAEHGSALLALLGGQ